MTRQRAPMLAILLTLCACVDGLDNDFMGPTEKATPYYVCDLTIKVVGSNGKALSGVNVDVTFTHLYGQFASKSEKTDLDGYVRMTGKAGVRVLVTSTYTVSKLGYRTKSADTLFGAADNPWSPQGIDHISRRSITVTLLPN
jgi:hypothetical protein